MSIGAFLIGCFGSSGPVVSPSGSGVTRLSSNNPTYAGVQYNTSGIEYANATAGTASYTVSRGNWLDSGTTSEVWLERTLNSGTLSGSDPGAGRHAMTSTRTLAVQDTTLLGGAVTCNVTVNFYDAASGGNLLGSATYTLSAEREAGG